MLALMPRRSVRLAAVLLLTSVAHAQVEQQAYIKASNTGASDQFGWSLAISGHRAVVGAYTEDSPATGVGGSQGNGGLNPGAAYAFVRSGGTWSQQAYLKASNTGNSDLFGLAVAISGDTIVVGAQQEDSSATGVNGNQLSEGTPDSGAAYVFVYDGAQWKQQAYLKASNPGVSDWFGTSVAISGDTIVVGAHQEDSAATGVDGDGSGNGAMDSGAAYVFRRNGSTWSQEAYLKASNTGTLDHFAYSVAIDGDTIVVGAFGEDSSASGVDGDETSEGASGSGAAYVFVRNGTLWSQEAYVKASNPDQLDEFGWAVDVSGDSCVVTAPFEASSATGIDGDQVSDGTFGAGAAYVFARLAGSWSQEAYVKASNTGTSDSFGWSVALAGDRLVVGAPEERSAATGIDGDQLDDSAAGAGAAYAFVRSGTRWSQHAYIKAANNEAGDNFALDVSLSAASLLAGAPLEDSSATGVDGDQASNGSFASGAAEVFDLDGPWQDLGAGLAGVTGVPELTGTGTLVAASPVTLELNGAKPLASAPLVVGLSLLFAPFKGGVMVPDVDLVLSLVTDASGDAQLAGVWPGGIPSGLTLGFQWWVQDPAGPKGFAASNALAATTP
jgi:FG-GAP repeat